MLQHLSLNTKIDPSEDLDKRIDLIAKVKFLF